ncbi:MAG: hypothetical protein ABSB35_27800 [Bryobacteraceae bacterium]|jgi:hypothetical protein
MALKTYFPISIAFFVLVVGGAIYYSAPILPFALILLAGETLLGFQLEDHKVPRLLSQIFRAPKEHKTAH